MEDIDRIEFYEKLGDCKNRQDIENLIENIEDDDLQIAMQDKMKQILEINKDEELKSIIRILEYSYLKYEKSNNKN